MKINLKSTAAWLSVTLGLIAAVWLATSPTRGLISEAETSLLRKKQLLERLEALPEKEGSLRERLALLDGGAADKLLYRGDFNEVQVLLQRDLREIANTLGLSLRSVRPSAKPRKIDGLARASVQIVLETSNEGLLEFLASMEGREPLLRTHSLSVAVSQRSTQYSAAVLTTAIEVTGFYAEELN